MTRFTLHACIDPLSDGDTLPLSQPQSAHGTLVGGSSCPGTPEMRRRQEEALRRLASQVPTNTNIIYVYGIYPVCHSISLSSLCLALSLCFPFLSVLLSTKVYCISVATSNIYMRRVSQHTH